jgi:hypothetical protein
VFTKLKRAFRPFARRLPLWIALFAILLFVTALFAVLAKFPEWTLERASALFDFPSTRSKENLQFLGQFGDLFGPFTAFVSVLSLFGVLLSVAATSWQLQQSEARELTRTVEESFGRWMDSHYRLLDDFDVPDTADRNGGQGKKALVVLWRDLHWNLRQPTLNRLRVAQIGLDLANQLDSYLSKTNAETLRNSPEMHTCALSADEGANHLLEQETRALFQSVYIEYEYQFDAYFRHAYHAMKWIDELPGPRELRWNYAKRFRAQLSWIEMAWLFLNCTSHRGQKMRAYAERYALFDNLSVRGDLLVFMKHNLAETAFNSAQARATN